MTQTLFCVYVIWAPSQYPKRRLIVRSREVSKPRDLYLELSDRWEIWQALRQQCCRCACQISKRYDNLKCQIRGCETLRDLTKRRLFWYWDGVLVPISLWPAHPLYPIRSKSRYKRRNLSPDDLGSGPYTPFIIYIPYIIAALYVIKISCL